MGKEQTCDAVIDGVRTHGRALLETDEVLFRGTPKLKLPLKDIKKVLIDGEDLELRHKAGVVRLALGAKQAAAWAKRIQEPPGLLDKLGVKEGTRVTVVTPKGLHPHAGGLDDDFVHSLELRGASVRRGRKGKDADLVFLGAETLADLKNAAGLATLMHPAGGIWIFYPKGRKDLREADVMAAGRAAGWNDNKTCRVSETHTALRFVIPLADRPGRATAAAKPPATRRSAGRSKGR